jgi:tripartite-type tricarboxylate transporter receptor subunit TctC
MGHAGVGSFSYLVGMLVPQQLGVNVTQVPYRGAGPAPLDALAGEVDLESRSAVGL